MLIIAAVLKDLIERAEMMLEQAEKIDSRAFVTARVRVVDRKVETEEYI
jgi:hypothetical protein